MKSILKIKNLNAGYKDVQILKNIDLELEPSTISVLMGPNGAGKSTLLKSIFNITDISSGSLSLEDKDITKLPSHKLLELGVAFVSQGKVNFGNLSVKDNLILGAHLEKDKNKIETKIKSIFAQFPILEKKQTEYAFALSGGEQQMLAIGRALMSNPKLLLMDEPSLGLSPKLVKEIFEHIRKIKEEFGVTILIVEHNLKSLMEIADYGFVLVQGEIVAHDKCEILKNSEIMKKVFVGEFD